MASLARRGIFVDEWEDVGELTLAEKSWIKLCLRIAQEDLRHLGRIMDTIDMLEQSASGGPSLFCFKLALFSGIFSQGPKIVTGILFLPLFGTSNFDNWPFLTQLTYERVTYLKRNPYYL